MAPREVLPVGSVPVRPAEAVFETVARHLGTLAPRTPDGETMGWLRAVRASHARNPTLEACGETRCETPPRLVETAVPR